MDICVYNLSAESISVIPSHKRGSKPTTIAPSSSATVDIATHRPRLFSALHLQTVPKKQEEDLQRRRTYEIGPATINYGALKGWALVTDSESCPWRIYMRRTQQKTGAKREVFVLEKRDTSNFLKDIEDTRPLSDVCLPATHDSLALYGWPISQCQSLFTPYDIQLRAGVRVFDVRMAVSDGKLVAHHGVMPEFRPFQEVLTIMHAFLTDPKSSSETIVMSMKQEDFASTPPTTFSQLVHDEIYNGPGGRDMWFLEDRIPTLGEVRGKVIMLSRFGGDGSGWEGGLSGLGIHPTTWPDSSQSVFEWTCADTLVRTSDWYNIDKLSNIPEKFDLASGVLLPPSTGYAQPTLNIAFFSAASFPLALPPLVAKGFGWPAWHLGVEGINTRLGHWLLDQLSPSSNQVPRGWVHMDFFTTPGGLAPLLIECNFRKSTEPALSPVKEKEDAPGLNAHTTLLL